MIILLEKHEGKEKLGDLGIQGRIIFNDVEDTGFEDMDSIQVAPDGVEWRTLVNTAMNLRAA
jgi:hypothetical protein